MIELTPYSPIWKKFFDKESSALKKVLRSNVSSLHHIGSTAIKGISAYPTLDILCSVHSLDGIELFKEEFQKLGLTLNQGQKFDQSLTLTRFSPSGEKMCEVLIVEKTNPIILDCIDFRDYLNQEEKVAKKYEEAKTMLYKKHQNSELYHHAKGQFIKLILSNIS